MHPALTVPVVPFSFHPLRPQNVKEFSQTVRWRRLLAAHGSRVLALRANAKGQSATPDYSAV
jgi:hypothetical protein